MDSPEHQQLIQKPLPLVSVETCRKIAEEIGADVDSKTREIGVGITGEKQPPPWELMRGISMDVFSRIADVNAPFVTAAQEAIKDNLHLGNVPDRRTACAAGMGVVIRAFDMESNFNLVENFANLTDEDLEKVRTIVAEGLGGKKERDLLEQVLNSPKIPEQQVNLRSLVGKVSKSDFIYDREVYLGATTMYKVLSEMEPKLFPQRPQNVPSSAEPPSEV